MYLGKMDEKYIEMDKREHKENKELDCSESTFYKRRRVKY